MFRDPILTDLERRVAAENLDVQTATIRLAESRFQRGVAAAAAFPSVNGDAQYQRELYSINGPFQSPNGPFGPLGRAVNGLLQSSGSPPLPRVPIPFNEYYIGFDASWELDLWGRVRRRLNRPMRRSIRPPSNAAMPSSRASRNWRATISSCAAFKCRSGSL